MIRYWDAHRTHHSHLSIMHDPILYRLRVAGATIGTLCLLAGVLGNSLVLLSVWCYRPLRRVVNLFVASLAACDLVQTLTIRVLHVQTYFVGYWTLGSRTCAYALLVSNVVILTTFTCPPQIPAPLRHGSGT